MTQRLKRWESPRRQGRNDKGKGGSARQRQLKKQTQMLRKKLKESQKEDNQKNKGEESSILFPYFLLSLSNKVSLRDQNGA
ncbi:MAG: hypothetical protein F6K28_17845 [Microcoleus sp. SIO2G3]|nr:hypothetical protein [Microcoleus sp. SIO2G3]